VVWCESSISDLCVFGCVAFAHVPKQRKIKLNSKGVKCIFIGHCEKTKKYKLYNPISQYVIIDNDVIFDESKKKNRETMVSKLDFRLEQMVLNQKLRWRLKKFLNKCNKI
jgi:hypothetical protein